MARNQVSLECCVTINNDNVVSRELEGEAVILNLETGTYFGLNEVGTRIWALIQEHRSLGKVFEAMCAEYGASPETLKSDLLQLVEELRAKGLVGVSQRDERKETGS